MRTRWRKCPAGLPIGVTELRETIQFPYVGNGTDVALSSDKVMGTERRPLPAR